MSNNVHITGNLQVDGTINQINYTKRYKAWGAIFSQSSTIIYANIEYFRLSAKSGLLNLSFAIPENSITGGFVTFNLQTLGTLLGLSFKYPSYYISGTWTTTEDTNALFSAGSAVEIRTDGNCCLGRYYDAQGSFGGWSLSEMKNKHFTVNNLYVEEN